MKISCLEDKSVVHRLSSLGICNAFHTACSMPGATLSGLHVSPHVIPTAPPQIVVRVGAINTLQRKKPASRVLAQATELQVQYRAEDWDGGSDPKMLSCCAPVRNRASRAESSRNRAHPEPPGASHCHPCLHAVWRSEKLKAQEGAQCHHLRRFGEI